MALVLIDPPAMEPVTLPDLKSFLRVDHDEDDGLIASLAVAARQYVETAIGRQLVTASYALTEPWLPRVFTLPRPPLLSVESITLRDPDGSTFTVDPNDYLVEPGTTPGQVFMIRPWPEVGAFPNAVRIEFTCGYPYSEDDPAIPLVSCNASFATAGIPSSTCASPMPSPSRTRPAPGSW